MEVPETRSEKVMLCPPGTLSAEQRLKLLEELVGRLGAKRAAEKLGISRASLYRYLNKQREIPEELDPRLCIEFEDEELLAVLSNKQLLESAGVLKNGKLNIPLLIALIDAAMQNEEAKQVILKRFLTQYKEELQELLAQTIPRIELHWSQDFERWLTEKKSKPITNRTLKDYKNIWNACLEGKILGWHLLKQLEGKKMLCRDNKYHPTGWVRQVFRHYIRYLYAQDKLDWDTYSRLMLVVPGRRYGRKLRQKPIREEDVVKALQVLREKRPDIYLVYLLLLYSGVRFEHVVYTLKNWRPNEEFYVEYLDSNIKRLTCFETHCRYYLGMEGSVKPEAFMFFPRKLLPIIEEYRDRVPSRWRIYKVAVKKLGVLPPKLVRTYAIRLMKATIKDNDVYKFILGKFSEITTTGGSYLWLLELADQAYPNYAKRVEALVAGEHA